MRYKFILILIFISFQALSQNEDDYSLLDRLDGNWGMINYFDSTIIEKSIFKHSINPSSYAFKISFDKAITSECEFIGYHEGGPIPILEIEDNSIKIGYNWDQYSIITLVNDSILTFNEYVNPERNNLRADSKQYFCRKLKAEILDHQIYFSQLLTGQYKDSNNDTIYFSQGLKVTGIESFTTYRFLIDSWETRIGSFDVIQLIDKVSSNSIWMKWEFDKEELILTYLDKSVDEESGMCKYKPSKKKITLTKY
jgi:hypothetical protein